jgi:O-antigen biosynthesis protein
MKFNNIIFSDVLFNDRHSTWIEHFAFAFFLIDKLSPKVFVELGTYTGGSYFAFCQAIKTLSLTTKAFAVDTWQGDEHAGFYAKEVFDQVNQINQENYASFSHLLKTTFDDANQRFENSSIDLLHIDGLHTYEAVKHDFETWLPKMSEAGVMIFHDTKVKDRAFGVWKLMEELQQQYPYFEFEHGYGLGVVCTGTKISEDFLKFINTARDDDFTKNLFSSIGTKNLLECRQRVQTEQIKTLTDKIELLHQAIQLKDEVNNKLRKKTELQKQKSEARTKAIEDGLRLRNAEIEKLEQLYKHDELVIKIMMNSLSWKITFPLRKLMTFFNFINFKLLKQIRLIEKSRFFDKQFYLQNNPDVKASGMNPARHYQLYGGFEGRDPSEKFDTAFYLEQNPDVKDSGMNPLVHFIFHGKDEGRLSLNPIRNKVTDFNLALLNDENIDEIIQLKSALNLFPDDYQKFLHRNRLTKKMIGFLGEQQQEFSYHPLFSIVMPVYNPAISFLEAAINSVISQIYPNWELIIIDDHSNADVEKYLRNITNNKKLKLKRLDKNSGVSEATNEGIRLTTGDYILFMDHDDIIEKDALVQIANFLQNNKTDILYTDDGTISHSGMAEFPAFKPDWSPELALSFCYLRHIVVYSKKTIIQTGSFNHLLNGSQDYDFFLRATHFANKIDHLPIILYHWRNHDQQLHKINGSLHAGMAAVQNHIATSGIDWVKVSMPEFAAKLRLGIYRLDPSKVFDDLVSIIIPVRNGHLLLKKCIDSIKKTSYRNFEIIIANDESDDLETLDYLQTIQKQGIKVLTVERLIKEFNYSRLNNKAVEIARGDFLILLNSDTEIVSADWIEQLLMYCKMPGVGVVGAKLMFPDQRIQHAGVVVNMEKKPAHHPFTGSFGNGYMNFDLCARNYSAVTAGCLMVGKKDFIKIGGFDEANLKVSSNDVDLCLRFLSSEKRVVYNPNAMIIHHEGVSRNKYQKPCSYLSDDLNLISKHKNFKDRYYNPNQHNEELFKPDYNKNNRLRYFEKKKPRLKMMFFTHNLNIEGAPMVMFNVAKHLHATENFQIEVSTMADGPMRSSYEKEGITVSVMDVFPNLKKDNYAAFVQWLGNYLLDRNINLVYANTLDAFWAIDASYFAEIPSVWGIHESIDPIDYYNSHNHFKKLAPWIFKTILKTNRNVFVCKATMRLFEKYNHFANMDFIYNGVRFQSDHLPEKSKIAKKLNLPDKTIITIIGTICERKGQIDFVKTAKNLLKSTGNLHFMIIGKNFGDEYYQRLVDEIGRVADIVVLENQENILDFYKCSDIFVCCSYNESFPLVILEAMECSLPIVTTPVFGISEQLTDGETALFYRPGDVMQLENKIKYLLDHKEQAIEMGKKARMTVEVLFREEDMLRKYEDLFNTTALEDVIARPLEF